MARTKVVVLGGGMAGLTAAYQLAHFPERYDITVYQLGWRLGGKCAAGRNQTAGDRIEEHGLHVLFGWYENAFRVLRGAYADLGREPDAWREAVLPADALVAPEMVGGAVVPWLVKLPRNDDSPGDGRDTLASPAQYVKDLLAWVAAQLRPWRTPDGTRAASPAELDYVRGRIRELELDSRDGRLSGEQILEYPELARLLSQLSPEWAEPGSDDRRALEFLEDGFRGLISDDGFWYSLVSDDDARGVVDDLRTELRRLRIFVDFCYTAAKGILVDLVGRQRSWFDLDDRDLRRWLADHGGREDMRASPIVEAIYSAVFSTGTPGHTIAAGTMLQNALRAAFFWKGAAVYHPNGALADVLFAPLYRALKLRGVRFEFFHRVEELELAADRSQVARIRLARQAWLAHGVGEYDPLIQVLGADAWPNAPKLELLSDPDLVAAHDLESWWDSYAVGEVALDAGRDFDVAVLAISVAAIPAIFPDAMSDPANDRFAWMVRALATTQTQAFQMWCQPRKSNPDWPGPLPKHASVAIPYRMPFDTVADMRHVLPHERPRRPVSHLYYLCAGLVDDEPPPPRGDVEYPSRQQARVRLNAASWVSHLGGPLWDEAGPLVELGEPAEAEWFSEQYFNAPVNLSDRYVLVRPENTRYRLRPGGSGYANLALAGDWTLTAVSAGCLEGATVGGIDAARAIDRDVPKAAGDWLDDGPFLALARPPRVRARGHIIFRDGELLPQPPIAVPKLDVYTFLLSADERQLQRLCDAQLNLGAAARYRPLGPLVAFYAASMTNAVEPFGSADELDFGFWVPLIARDASGGERVVTFTPYAWVDSSWALVSGRSLFGYPKHMGELTFEPRAGRFALSTLALAEVGASARTLPLIEVRAHGCQEEPGVADWASFLAAGVRVVARLLDQGRVEAVCALIAQTLSKPGMPMVFLKQLPGVAAERSAAYQAIIEAPINLAPGPMSMEPLRGRAEIVVHRYQSHRVVDTLGLTAARVEPGRSVLEPLTQGHLSFAASVEAGVEVVRVV